MRTLFRSALTALLLFAAVPSARPQAEPAATRVYQNLLRSVVWVYTPLGGGKAATGTGSLIDGPRRLILTNYHVVGDTSEVRVVFPSYRAGKPVAEREFYFDQLKRGAALRGRVLTRDKRRDLALVEIQSDLPSGVEPLRLSADGASPGQSVHSVGNPGASGALWVYTSGTVRQVYHKRWQSQLGNEVATFEAQVVETTSATNQGDSGGPLVNDKGELVGVTQGGDFKARLVSFFIDVGEVKDFLEKNRVKPTVASGRTEARPVTARSEVRDGGKFFTDEAQAKARSTLRELAKQYGRDIAVETFAGPPKEKEEAVRAMSREERAKYFRDWARERLRADDLDGLVILVSRSPSYIQVEPTAGALGVFNEKLVKELVDALTAKFRAKQFDEGLAEAMQVLRERAPGRK